MMNSNTRGIWDLGPYLIMAYGIYKVCESTVNYFINLESTRNKTRFYTMKLSYIFNWIHKLNSRVSWFCEHWALVWWGFD